MKTFITPDFLLENDTAKQLYHDTAKDLPIIDYHNHLNPFHIHENKNYEHLTEVWLEGDHYKWRAMRANGISEKYITGDATAYDKFLAWARTVPNTLGNPLYHWTHLELLRYFQIDEVFNEKSAPRIWEEANAKLQTDEFRTRALLENKGVEFVGTTDDPTDDLSAHEALKDSDYSVTVSPSFRPDQGLAIDTEGFLPWLSKLENRTNLSILDYDTFLDALSNRIDFFDKHGCRSSDHGINVVFYEEATQEEVKQIFAKRLKGETLTIQEVDQFKTHTLVFLAARYREKDWVMQLHMNPLRNNNTRMFRKLGPDSGFDSIGDELLAWKLSRLLDEMDEQDKLPKTVLYSLNARDNDILAAMAGNFQTDEIAGKVQLGTAWWFNDTIEGMERQMKALANIGLISNFIGMLTDSRSFLSFSRHEYFRRVLCNLLGTWVEEGKAPKDMDLLRTYVRNICYENAKNYFNLKDS